MKTYIEAIEIITDLNVEPDFIRIDVSSYTDFEVQAIIQDVKDIMSGMTYTLKKHYCGHKENAGCSYEDIV